MEQGAIIIQPFVDEIIAHSPEAMNKTIFLLLGEAKTANSL